MSTSTPVRPLDQASTWTRRDGRLHPVESSLVRVTANRSDEVTRLLDQTWWGEGRDVDAMARVITDAPVALGVTDHLGLLVCFVRLKHERPGVLRLCDMVVEESLRGRGYGTRLLATLLAHPYVTSAEAVELRAVDEAAAFYERFGFVSVGRTGLMHRPTPTTAGARP